MADLTPIVGKDIAQAALAGQFTDSPNVQDLVECLAYPMTQIDTVTVQLQTWRDLDTATGVALDQIGQLLNQPRQGGVYPLGESDADYRPKLRAAILRNRSDGATTNLIAMLEALLTGYAPAIQFVDTPPAAFVVAIGVSSPLSAAMEVTIGEFLDAAKSAGVGIAGAAWYTAPTFAFAGFPDPPFKGYDDGTTAVGGYYAKYFWP